MSELINKDQENGESIRIDISSFNGFVTLGKNNLIWTLVLTSLKMLFIRPCLGGSVEASSHAPKV